MTSKVHPSGLKQSQTRIEVEVTQDRLESFKKKYESATKEKISSKDNHAITVIGKKWGLEMRIYLNANKDTVDYLKEKKLNVTNNDDYNNQYKYRINNNEFCWKLIKEYGFRLGDN